MGKIVTIILIAVSFTSRAQYPKVDIPGSELRKISSSIVTGQEYELHISLPAGYQNSDKYYPVVYLMDSQWDFPLLKSLYGQQYYDGFIPEMIIVGITWGGLHPNPDSLRVRDYTPTNVAGQPQSGGAEKFLSFMELELFPFMEKNYRADYHNRTIMGCSLGGLITMYALFTRPGLFNGYVAASPAFGWDKEVIYQYEEKYFNSKPPTPARLFMAMGGVERSLPGFEKLARHLSERKYSNLKVIGRVLENTGHSGTKAEGFARGLQFVFEEPKLDISQEELQKLTGYYKTDNGSTMELKIEGSDFVIYVNKNNRFRLFASSENDYYARSEFLRIHFSRNERGMTTGFTLERYGSNLKATRAD